MAEAVDNAFYDAVEALKQDDKARAKEILTRLIKADQNNATYWIWMSAAVDTHKERVYCLETALKVDPGSALARRGLVLLGALPPDKDVKPLFIDRRRAWEESMLLDREKPGATGLQAISSSPGARLAGLVALGLVVVAAVVIGIFNPRTSIFPSGIFATAGPSPTYTATPTFVNIAAPAATAGKPTPLAVLLGVSYTATPVYANTPRSPESLDIYRAAQAAFAHGNWDEYFREMDQIRKLEPLAADVPYDIAEGYRAKGDCSQAVTYYNESLKVNKEFAPAYLGLARARQCQDPGADTTSLYELALRADPRYGEVYLDRADFYLARKDFKDALADLDQARRLMPNSALVQVAYAQAYLLQGDNDRALAAARKANSIDLTLLASYYYLGRTLIEDGQYADGIKALQLYLLYEPQDSSAYAEIGHAYAETQEYDSAIDSLNQALRLDPNQVDAFVYLGTSYLRLDNLAGAEVNFKRAIQYFPNSFEASIGLTEVYYRKGTYGTAYLQSETAKARATNDTQLALAIYWRALCQEGRQSFGDAIKDWKTLLGMSASAMTSEMRTTAQEHLKTIVPPTNTPKLVSPTATPTITPTNRPGNTATPPPRTNTPSPTPTKTPTATKTP